MLVCSSVLTESEVQREPIPPDFEGLVSFLPWLGETLQAVQTLFSGIQSQLESTEESADAFRV